MELVCLGGRGAEKVKRCETAASSGSRPRAAWELERRGAETFTFIIGTCTGEQPEFSAGKATLEPNAFGSAEPVHRLALHIIAQVS